MRKPRASRAKRDPLDPCKGKVSKDATFASLLIRMHYEEIGLHEGWTSERFNRLCRMLGCTAYELGELCCINGSHLTEGLKHRRFSRVASLHFAIIEAWFLHEVLEKEQTPIVPIDALRAA